MSATVSYRLPALTRLERAFFSVLERTRYGSAHVTMPDGSRLIFTGSEPGVEAHWHMLDRDVMRRILTEGDIGFGEDYVAGRWESQDIGGLMTWVCQNAQEVERYFNGQPMFRLYGIMQNLLRGNTRKGSQRNIMAHYDLGNEFYRLWLDETMTYSSALFQGAGEPLASAQRNKYTRILQRLNAGNDQSVLEVGCGWGGFAEQAGREGWDVTALTISPAQAEFASKRLAGQKLSRADVRCQDYRDAGGMYDNIVSIEMFEAVGEQYWPAYFSMVKQRLREHGRALIQTITIHDPLFESYRRRSDFIRKHIFPGGMLPSRARFTEECQKAGLKVREAFAFGQDYSKTLGEWLKAFDARMEEVMELGFSPEFIRKWRYYLAACMGGFAGAHTDVVQFELAHS